MTYLTPFILFIFGVLIWRHQLSAKRRFEIAEQVLAAFYKASDGFSTLRSRMIWAGEIEATKPKKDSAGPADHALPRIESEEQKRQEEWVETYNVYVARLETISPAFAELRAAQILAEIHFGRPAAEAMNVLFRGRHEVFLAVKGLYGGPRADYFPDAESRERHRQFEVSMRRVIAEHRSEDGTPDDTDKLSQRIDAARATLESICRPFLADPRWLTAVRRAGSRMVFAMIIDCRTQ